MIDQACDIEIISVAENECMELRSLHSYGTGENDLTSRQIKSRASYSQFSIPPIYRDSINRFQLPVFEVASKVLKESALLDEGNGDIRDKTDVIFCNCLGMDRAFKNFQRLYGKFLVGNACESLDNEMGLEVIKRVTHSLGEQLGSSSHDKVGEMASTIPARVAAHFGLKGRAFVLESKDESFIHGLAQAVNALQLKKCKAVLILSGQSLDSASSAEYIETAFKEVDNQDMGLSGVAVEGVAGCILSRPGTFSRANGSKFPRIKNIYLGRLADGIAIEPLSIERPTIASEFRSIEPSDVAQLLADRDASINIVRPEYERGYSYVNAPLSAMNALIRSIPSFESQGHGIVCGKSSKGNECVIEIDFSCFDQPSLKTLEQHPVSVVSASAIFGDAVGNDAYWQRLTDECGAIVDIGNHFSAKLFDQKRSGIKDSYYNYTASFNPESPPQYAEDLSNISQSCLSALALEDHVTLSDRVLVVTATCLTGFHEKLSAFTPFLPELKRMVIAALNAVNAPAEAINEVIRKIDSSVCSIGNPVTTLGSDLSASILDRISMGADCIAVEAACAGSLAALDIAVSALQAGRVDCAIVLGVEHPVNVNDMTLCSSQRMLAPEVIATFTELATGFTPGNGAGAIILRRNDDHGSTAKMHIRAVGASTWSKSVIAPNAEGQVSAMRAALEDHDSLIAKVHFVETHGTGTTVGDAVEIESINEVYGCGQRQSPLYLGALKSRFGHTFAAAGMASLIKTYLIAQNGKIPPNLIRGPIKESLGLDDKNLDVLQSEIILNSGETYTTAINAFGTGGINYHVLSDITVA